MTRKVKDEDVAELAAGMALSVPKVWCYTCQHPHEPTMPAHTWRCSDCGFGSWNTLTAARHSLQEDHATHPVMHHMVTIEEVRCSVVLANGQRCENTEPGHTLHLANYRLPDFNLSTEESDD